MSRIVIASDPPWHFNKRKTGTKFGGGASAQYPMMSDKEILRLHEVLGKEIAKANEENVAYFLWSTCSHTKLAMKCIDKMEGFRFATLAFNWVKINKDGTPWAGPGSYTGIGSELCWLAVKGSMPPVQKLVPQVILAPKGEHSEKPDEARRRIELMFSDSTRNIELFGRKSVKNWEVYGNQITKNDIFVDVENMF